MQKACLAAPFEANPAGCPAASKIGHAVVHTPDAAGARWKAPCISSATAGEVPRRRARCCRATASRSSSHGETFINGKTGITTATFRNTPDVPFESIEVSIPEGPFSEFGANLPAKATTSAAKSS